MIVDLDKLMKAADYLKRIDETPFEEMEFIKDGKPIDFSLEPLQELMEMGFSNAGILKRAYKMLWRGKRKERRELEQDD